MGNQGEEGWLSFCHWLLVPVRFMSEVTFKKKRKLTSTFVDIALIKNNARVGSSIAAELCKIRKLKETNAVVSLKSVDC